MNIYCVRNCVKLFKTFVDSCCNYKHDFIIITVDSINEASFYVNTSLHVMFVFLLNLYSVFRSFLYQLSCKTSQSFFFLKRILLILLFRICKGVFKSKKIHEGMLCF